MNTSMTCSYSAHLSGRIKHVTTGLLLSLVHTRGQCSSLPCVFITNSPAPSRINSAELPQRDVTVWEFAIFGYFPCIIRTVRTRSFNHKHKHRKMAIFCYFFSRFFCSFNWEFSYSNWEKNILFGIGNTTEYRSSKRAKKNPAPKQI